MDETARRELTPGAVPNGTVCSPRKYIRMADHLYQCPAMVRIVEDMVGFEEPCGVDEIESNSGTVPTMGFAFRPIRSGDWQSPEQMREHSICKTSERGPAYQQPGLACLVWYRYL